MSHSPKIEFGDVLDQEDRFAVAEALPFPWSKIVVKVEVVVALGIWFGHNSVGTAADGEVFIDLLGLDIVVD